MSQESKLRVKIRRSKIQKAILTTLALAGLMSVAVLAPNVLAIVRQLNGGKRLKSDQKYSIKPALARLCDSGHIQSETGKQGIDMFSLTPRGEEIVGQLEDGAALKKPPRWDGRWRIIIFDIIEARRNTRNRFRHTLEATGFIKLQRSVWVYPYDCEDLIALIKMDFKIGKEILYLIADSIENDRRLRQHYELPLS